MNGRTGTRCRCRAATRPRLRSTSRPAMARWNSPRSPATGRPSSIPATPATSSGATSGRPPPRVDRPSRSPPATGSRPIPQRWPRGGGWGGSRPTRSGRAAAGAPKSAQRVIYPTLAKDFPTDALVAPVNVTLKAQDGVEFHNQLFLPKDLKPGEKRPAIIFVHGGPIRQMLLGDHYMGFYHTAYQTNQRLQSMGY